MSFELDESGGQRGGGGEWKEKKEDGEEMEIDLVKNWWQAESEECLHLHAYMNTSLHMNTHILTLNVYSDRSLLELARRCLGLVAAHCVVANYVDCKMRRYRAL